MSIDEDEHDDEEEEDEEEVDFIKTTESFCEAIHGKSPYVKPRRPRKRYERRVRLETNQHKFMQTIFN